MIKLVCPRCDRDDISYNDEDDAKTFICLDCETEFDLIESEWRTE